MAGELPLILVVGGDALSLRVCEELCATEGHRVALVWQHDHDVAARLEAMGCAYIPLHPNDYEHLKAAGVLEATSIMALSEDDRLNLQVALKARDLSPQIRVVLRQFNRTLGRKIEQNLPNCSVLSLAAHAAASFTAAAVDKSCFYAIQYPDVDDGVLVGFSERHAFEFGVAGMTWHEAQTFLRSRIVAIDGAVDPHPERRIMPEDLIVVFGEMRHLVARTYDVFAGTPRVEESQQRSLRDAARRAWYEFVHMDPIIARIIVLTVIVAAISTVYYSFVLHRDPVTALYFVLTTMTSTGYGDITPLDSGPVAKLAANAIMVIGVALTGIFTAFATSALTRAQFQAIQGVRRIRTAGHVVVVGVGNVGSRVIAYLRSLNQKIVVVDPAPDPTIIELSRRRQIELLTGDATQDLVLDLCNLRSARAVICLTDADTANLEIALGARARNPSVPVVMRVQDAPFARSISRQFEAIRTLSTAVLTAPAFAGLSRFPGSRGRISFGDEDYNIGERLQGEIPAPPPADHCIALGVWRKGAFLHINEFSEMEPFDRLLFIVPLSQFRNKATSKVPLREIVPVHA